MLKKGINNLKNSLLHFLRLILSLRRALFLLLFIWFYISGFRAIDLQRPKELTIQFQPETQILIEESRLKNLLSVNQRILNNPLPLVHWSQLEQQLTDLPQVKSAQFFLKKPHEVQLNLTFYKALFYINVNGKFYLLNEKFNIMPLSPLLVFNLPILHIQSETQYYPHPDSLIPLKLKPYQNTLYLIHNDPFWSKWIADIVITNEGEVTIFPEIGHFQIHFGRYFTSENLKRLSLLLKHGLPYIEWKNVEAIDLRFQNQIVVRMNTKNQSKI